MSSRSATSSGEGVASCLVEPLGLDDVTSTGPLAPGPNSSATRSKALRVVSSDGWAEASCGQVRIAQGGRGQGQHHDGWRAGAHATGRRPTRVAQRSMSGLPVRARARRTRRGSSRRPSRPHSAGHQRQRRGRDDDDGDRGGVAEGVVRRQPGQLQAEQRDQHGRGGEDHRPAGRGDRAAGGLVLVEAGGEELGEPGDQQQRVVDADAEADHRGHHRGRGADVHRRRPAG